MFEYDLDEIRGKVCRLTIDIIIEKGNNSQLTVQIKEAQLEGYINGLIEALGLERVKEILS